MERLSGTMLDAFALALGLPEAWFEDKVDRHRSAPAGSLIAAPSDNEVSKTKRDKTNQYICAGDSCCQHNLS